MSFRHSVITSTTLLMTILCIYARLSYFILSVTESLLDVCITNCYTHNYRKVFCDLESCEFCPLKTPTVCSQYVRQACSSCLTVLQLKEYLYKISNSFECHYASYHVKRLLDTNSSSSLRSFIKYYLYYLSLSSTQCHL